MSFQTLPNDILYLIMGELTYDEIIKLSQVSKRYTNLCHNTYIWRKLLSSRYPKIPYPEEASLQEIFRNLDKQHHVWINEPQGTYHYLIANCLDELQGFIIGYFIITLDPTKITRRIVLTNLSDLITIYLPRHQGFSIDVISSGNSYWSLDRLQTLAIATIEPGQDCLVANIRYGESLSRILVINNFYLSETTFFAIGKILNLYKYIIEIVNPRERKKLQSLSFWCYL